MCAVNPDIQHLLMKVGYKALAPVQYDEEKELAFVPMCLDLKDLCSSLHRFVKQQQGDVFQVPMPSRLAEMRYRKAA